MRPVQETRPARARWRSIGGHDFVKALDGYEFFRALRRTRAAVPRDVPQVGKAVGPGRIENSDRVIGEKCPLPAETYMFTGTLPEGQPFLWKPDILTDHHEMGSNSTFFLQPGIPSRTNLTPLP